MKYFNAWLALTALMTSVALAETPETDRGGILSAFFGIDNGLPIKAMRLCIEAPGKDGMPVIFSSEIDDKTLDTDDFRVTTASGDIGRVDCVTLRPADEAGEKRTVLLIGAYGSADDQPAKVEIVGDLMSLDGRVNFRGAQSGVIPLEAGPTMILAETLSPKAWSLGGRGNCPRTGVKGVVRATWVGGVTKPGGAEIDGQEMQLYRVTVRRADGSVEKMTPMAVGDLNDNDNNHDLCLGTDAQPLSVFFPAGALTDPNEDLNPDTEIPVSSASGVN